MSIEEQRLRSYVECFNRHDVAGVMVCFDDHPLVVDMLGKRHEGRDEIRRFYELQFAMFPDARCDITMAGRAWLGPITSSPTSLSMKALALTSTPVVAT